MSEKTRYTDEELQEFKSLILEKLAKAQRDYEMLRADLTNLSGNDTADTSPTFKVLEEGAAVLNKEEARSTGTASDEVHTASSGRIGEDREQDVWHMP